MSSPILDATSRLLGPARAGAAAVTLLTSLLAPAAGAGGWQASGSLVDLSVEVEGSAAPLYPARDGSGRYYLEARTGSAYAVHVVNRSPQRLGVVVAVDGLNAISGAREAGPTAGARPGRMYVLDPWEDVRVRGWRTSLEDVRQFTFVDERASYAARTGQANGKMGWIEAWVYRERSLARVSPPRPLPWDRGSSREESPRDRAGDAEAQPRPQAAPPPEATDEAGGAAPEAAAPKLESKDGLARRAPGTPEAYPGTGWGSHAWDPATVVSFDAQDWPSDRLVVRYEYAPALRALGILPPAWPRDRLAERERGQGFARPPQW